MVNKQGFAAKGKSSVKGKVTKMPASVSVYCHLCKINLNNNEEFKLHIMQKHRPRSKLYEGESDSSSDSDAESPLEPILGDTNVSHDENNENFDPDILCSDKTINNSISETAVSPQSSSSLLKSKENIRNKVQIAGDQLDLKTPVENKLSSLPTTSLNAESVPTFSAQSSVGVNPQVKCSNYQLPLVNPLFIQSMTNDFQGSSQSALQSEPVPDSSGFLVISMPAFTLNAKNIVEWYDKWKELSKPLNAPLPKRYMKKIETVYKAIFDNIHLMVFLTDPEKLAILEVFEEMKGILDKNLELFGENL